MGNPPTTTEEGFEVQLGTRCYLLKGGGGNSVSRRSESHDPNIGDLILSALKIS
jgi:hypothetical protein